MISSPRAFTKTKVVFTQLKIAALEPSVRRLCLRGSIYAASKCWFNLRKNYSVTTIQGTSLKEMKAAVYLEVIPAEFKVLGVNASSFLWVNTSIIFILTTYSFHNSSGKIDFCWIGDLQQRKFSNLPLVRCGQTPTQILIHSFSDVHCPGFLNTGNGFPNLVTLSQLH